MSDNITHLVQAWRGDDEASTLPIACTSIEQGRAMFQHVLSDAETYDHARLSERAGPGSNTYHELYHGSRNTQG